MNALYSHITWTNKNKQWATITLLLCVILNTVFSGSAIASSDVMEKYYGKAPIFKKKDLSLYLSRYERSTEKFCSDAGNGMRVMVHVFYNRPHVKRLEVMGASYTAFIKDTVIPTIDKICGGRVDPQNLLTTIFMHKKEQVIMHLKDPNKSWIQDQMYFDSNKDGVTFTKYLAHESSRNLTESQINEIMPDYLLEKREAAREEVRKARERKKALDKAAIEKYAESDRRKRDRQCDGGCVKLCNESSHTYTIAAAHMQSAGLTYGSRIEHGNRVEIEGWWELKPGKCFYSPTALFWQTYYSVARISPNGKWYYPELEINQALMERKERRGMSGVRNRSMCVNKSGEFLHHIPGRIDNAFGETCPRGYVKAPVNLYTEGEVDYRATYSIK